MLLTRHCLAMLPWCLSLAVPLRNASCSESQAEELRRRRRRRRRRGAEGTSYVSV